MRTATLYFDGGANPNPGRGYGSYEISVSGSIQRKEKVNFDGRLTNNQAEYMTMIEGLIALRGMDIGQFKLTIWSDSKLVVEQMMGRWKVRHQNMKALHRQALLVLGGYPALKTWTAKWNPRQINVEKFGH